MDLKGKVIVLLVIALAIAVGFGLFSYQAYSYTKTSLTTTSEQLATTEKNFQEYQAQVVINNTRLDALLLSLKEIKGRVNVAIGKIQDYPATPVLDEPWPSDFIRMRPSTGADVPTSKSSSSVPVSK